MKNLRTAAIIALFVLNISSIIFSFEYYKNVVEHPNPIELVRGFFLLIIQLLELVLCAVSLFGPEASYRDKAYRLLRFVFVMNYIFYIPLTIFLLQYMTFQGSWLVIVSILLRATGLFCFVALLVAKPERPIPRIDLGDYQLVSYTSTGHRFVHYLLDALFLLPIMLSGLAYIEYFDGGIGLRILAYTLYYGAYFFYSFLSEAIFRQTFGKMLTNSCVVSNGINLTTGRVLLRTLCRYIPFDGFSFLWGGNWHDSVSSTSVVYVDSWEKVFEEEIPAQESLESIS